MTMPETEIYQMDLRSASIHEASHAVIARVLGLKVHRIELRELHRGPGWRRVVGRIYFDYRPNYSSPEFQHAWPTINLAGFVGESFDDQREDTAVDGLMDDVYWGLDSMSEKDRAGAGEITYARMWRTLYLVRKHWPEIEMEAAIARDAFESMQKLAA
jgi:hypothetical protein